MTDTQRLVALYMRMRSRGMDVRAALDVLRDAIDALDDADRLELAQRIRTQEAGEAPARPSPIHRISDSNREPADGVTCPHCGKRNHPGEVLCYGCGQVLANRPGEYQTQILEQLEPAAPGDDYFGDDSVLLLTAHNTRKVYQIRPQESSRELVLGRRTNHGPMTPDIDLSDSDGNRLGVSRLHLSIRYDTQYHTLTVFDLGSANGSFVNGQRLHPHEVRVLRHNDELRLGNMLLSVAFQHRTSAG